MPLRNAGGHVLLFLFPHRGTSPEHLGLVGHQSTDHNWVELIYEDDYKHVNFQSRIKLIPFKDLFQELIWGKGLGMRKGRI